uniref:Uncharacterized protein n=1 Tax=viral metagenome TaxID=1070528 RepID=A0A6C0C8W2_9ZZZZ
MRKGKYVDNMVEMTIMTPIYLISSLIIGVPYGIICGILWPISVPFFYLDYKNNKKI